MADPNCCTSEAPYMALPLPQTSGQLLRNKLKQMDVLIGRKPTRDASEYTQIMAQRSSKYYGETVMSTITTVAAIRQLPTVASISGGESDRSRLTFTGGYIQEKSNDALVLQKAGCAVCSSDIVSPFLRIPAPVSEVIFSPRDITGLVAWFDATDPTTLYSDTVSQPATTGNALTTVPTLTTNTVVGGYVSYWKAKTGSYIAQVPAPLASYGTQASYPTRVAAAPGVQGGIQFNGYEMSFYNTADKSYGISVPFIDAGMSVFIVTQADQSAGDAVLLDREGTNTQPFGPTYVTNTGVITYRQDAQISPSGNTSLPGVTSTEYNRVADQLPSGRRAILYFDRSWATASSSGTARNFINGSQVASLPSITGVPASDIRYRSIGRASLIGGGPNSDPNSVTKTNLRSPSGFVMYEIYIFNGVLAEGDRQKMEGYLATKHGFTLPANHPYAWIPVRETPFSNPMVEAPCKAGASPGITYTGPDTTDPFRGMTRPPVALNKIRGPNGCTQNQVDNTPYPTYTYGAKRC